MVHTSSLICHCVLLSDCHIHDRASTPVDLHHRWVGLDGSMNSRLRWLCAVAIGAPVLLAACGGSAGSASSSTTTTTSAGRGAQGSAFTACLKQHGVTLPAGGFGGSGGGPGGGGPPQGPSGTPPSGLPGGGTGGAGPSISIPGVSQQKVQAAFSACQSKLPRGGRFGGGGANAQDLQAYTSCLGDHGVKVPTPGSGSRPSSGPGLGALRSDPKFAAANKVCAPLLPSGAASTSTTIAR